MPDIIIYNRTYNKILFIEAYNVTGAIDNPKFEKFNKILENFNGEKKYITAFADRKKIQTKYRQYCVGNFCLDSFRA